MLLLQSPGRNLVRTNRQCPVRAAATCGWSTAREILLCDPYMHEAPKTMTEWMPFREKGALASLVVDLKSGAMPSIIVKAVFIEEYRRRNSS